MIGRAAGNAVRLADPSVSRLHARIRATADGGATLEDAGSSYGTWLDGRRATAARLRWRRRAPPARRRAPRGRAPPRGRARAEGQGRQGRRGDDPRTGRG